MRSEQARPRTGRRLPAALGILSGLLLLCGLALVGPGLVRESAEGGPQGRSHQVVPGHRAPATHVGDQAPKVRPARLDIPSIAVSTPLLSLGLQKNGEIEVPPLTRAGVAGWYRHSPAPGDPGPSVIVGHVDSESGPAVFYRLTSLRTGDRIDVRRTDGKVAEFRVTLVRSYLKTRFPTKRVYGPIRHAGLRLITCSGQYVSGAGGYQSNTVVYATLHRLRPAEKPGTEPAAAQRRSRTS